MNVQIFKIKFSSHKDIRRKILNCILPRGRKIPFSVKQVKIITVSDRAVKEKLILGNHYHSGGRWELYFIVGAFRFRFKKIGGIIKEKIVKTGNACLIPSNVTHAFLALKKNSQLWGLSNKKYLSKDNKKDKIF